MGGTDGTDDAVDARREFVRRLRAHPAVRRVDFSRDGFRTVVVVLDPEAELRDRWVRTATRLGYDVERVASDEGRAENAWWLELEGTEGSAGRSTWRGTVRRAADRARGLIDRLLGRSGR